MSNLLMPAYKEAKKPSDEHGMKDAIENTQKKKMSALVNEIRECVKNHVYDGRPKELFGFIGERLKSQNINEAKFADFMIKDADKSLTHSIRSSFLALSDMFEAGEPAKRKGKDSGDFVPPALAIPTNTVLVQIAECIKEANAMKMTVSDLSERMSDAELERFMSSKNGAAEEWWERLRDRERELLTHSEATPHVENIEELQRKGEGLLRKGRFKEANSTFINIVNENPHHVKAWMGIAEAYLGIADKNASRILQLKDAYPHGNIPDEAFREFSECDKAAKTARVFALRHYEAAFVLLSEGKDTSKIEDPKKAIEECKKKMDLLERTKQD